MGIGKWQSEIANMTLITPKAGDYKVGKVLSIDVDRVGIWKRRPVSILAPGPDKDRSVSQVKTNARKKRMVDLLNKR